MDPLIPDALRAAMTGRYEPSRELGRGGMATVYLARDLKHQRDVALKVLRPDLAATLGADRFLKEIEIVARLVHPHILALHDSGESAGYLYYVMPYIEGGSLRQRLLDRTRFPFDEAVSIAGPVADALAYAHRMGVVHRDIKPENILFAQGHPVVADFGIAKAVSTAGGANLTRTGFPLGTPGYMSPEQAVGLTELDARTDVYSLAVVLYEMVVGETPGHWPTEESVRAGRLREAPASHRTQLDKLPRHAEAALARALASRAEDRLESPATLLAALRDAGALPAAPRRRYSDDEVREIVRRATELELNSPTLAGNLTLGGIEQVAAEAGIALDKVHQAVDAVSRVGTTSPPQLPAVPAGPSGEWPDKNPALSRFLGERTSLVFEKVVDGEIAEADFPPLIEECRMVLAQVGQVNTLGRSVSWSTIRSSSGTGRDVQVLISVRGGQTRIQIRENLGNLQGGIWGGIGGGMGGGGAGPIIGGIVDGLNAPGLLFFAIPAWLVVTYATARASYFYSVRRRRRSLEDLMNRLVQGVLDMARPTPGALPGVAPQPALPRGR